MSEDLVHVPIRVGAERIDSENHDEVLEKINRHTIAPVKMDEIFTFSGVCSNDRLDAYLTRMDPNTSLKNYREDLINGISLLDGHDVTKSPYGRSYDAELESSENQAVRGHWYIARDTVINGESTNDRIKAIRTGITKDMSVGFGGQNITYRCSSCGRDLLTDWECTHIPGLEDEDGRMSFAWIDNARLREVSTVYKGATPGALIEKARSFVNQGQLSQNNIMRLEREFQVRLDNGDRSFFMPKKKEDEEMSYNMMDELRKAIRENKIEKGKVYEILTEEGEPFRQPDDIAIRNELGDHANVSAIRLLKKEAQQGRRYLADTIDEAVSMRVKAQGDTFNAESYRTMLATSGDIDHIKEEIDSYEKLAQARFTSGRQTQDEDLDNEDDEQDQETIRKQQEEFVNENFFDKGAE